MTERLDVADTGHEFEEAAEFFPRGERGSSDPVVTVYVFRDDEGTLVIQVDTVTDERVRVNLNDGSVYDRHTETGKDFGDDANGTRSYNDDSPEEREMSRQGVGDFGHEPMLAADPEGMGVPADECGECGEVHR